MNVAAFRPNIVHFLSVAKDRLMTNCNRSRNSRTRGFLLNFSKGNFVTVARNDFTAGEKPFSFREVLVA